MGRIGSERLSRSSTGRVRAFGYNWATQNCLVSIEQDFEPPHNAAQKVYVIREIWLRHRIELELPLPGVAKKLKFIQNNPENDSKNLYYFLVKDESGRLTMHWIDCLTSGVNNVKGTKEIRTSNTLDFEVLSNPSQSLHLVLSGGVEHLEVLGYNNRVDVIKEVDSSNLTKTVLEDLRVISGIAVRWANQANTTIDLVAHGDGSHFFNYIVEVESTLPETNATKEHRLVVRSKQRYLKPTTFVDAFCDSTLDFIICILYSQKLGSYTPIHPLTPNQKIRIADKNETSIAVWAKTNGAFKGTGYTYRIEQIDVQNPRLALIIRDYSENQISYLKRKNQGEMQRTEGIVTLTLTNQISISFNRSMRNIRRAVLNLNLNFTTNNWTEAGRTLLLGPAEYNEGYKDKIAREYDFVGLGIGFLFVCAMSATCFFTVKEIKKGRRDSSPESIQEVLNYMASIKNTETGRGSTTREMPVDNTWAARLDQEGREGGEEGEREENEEE